MTLTYTEPFLLSDRGSTRGSAYTFSNKSLTLNGKTHVVWLDAIAEVKGRTYDHGEGIWDRTVSIGSGYDNHTTPAITADKDGFLSIAYGPHVLEWNNGQFKYARSGSPNDISEWVQQGDFGYRATYACLTGSATGRDLMVYRGGESPHSTMFQKTRPEGGWTTAQALFGQDIEPQYTHCGSILSAAEDGILYVASHFYNVGRKQHPVHGDRSSMRSYGAALIKSEDQGVTWVTAAGKPVRVPTLYNEDVAVPPLNGNVRVLGLALDADEKPVLLVGSPRLDMEELMLVTWTGSEWATEDLASVLPSGWIATGGSLTIDTAGRIHAAVMAVDSAACNTEEPDRVWGHPSTEIFHIQKKGIDLTCSQISETDPQTASWLPNISRQQLFAPVENPVVLYTHGVKGEGCLPPDTTEVYSVFIVNE